MFALQGKVRVLIVIEQEFGPFFACVAAFALVTETRLVLVVFLVASDAFMRGAAVFHSGFVTANTGNAGMGVLQRKIRLVVVKSFFIQIHDPCVSPFVIGVTTVAGLRLNLPVEAGFLTQVLRNVFVAVATHA
jgi:hypothetical protein